MSDSLIDGTVDSGSQQQLDRAHSQWGSWDRLQLEHGLCRRRFSSRCEWPTPPIQKSLKCPSFAKTLSFVDAGGKLSVRVPALRHDSSGITWRGGSTPAAPSHSTAFSSRTPATRGRNQRARLAAGKNLLFLPASRARPSQFASRGRTPLSLASGFATLQAPPRATAALTTADVDGVGHRRPPHRCRSSGIPGARRSRAEGKPRRSTRATRLSSPTFSSASAEQAWAAPSSTCASTRTTPRRSHLDLARRPRLRRWLELEHQCQRHRSKRRSRHRPMDFSSSTTSSIKYCGTQWPVALFLSI